MRDVRGVDATVLMPGMCVSKLNSRARLMRSMTWPLMTAFTADGTAGDVAGEPRSRAERGLEPVQECTTDRLARVEDKRCEVLDQADGVLDRRLDVVPD
jgi:hypothetical protein